MSISYQLSAISALIVLVTGCESPDSSQNAGSGTSSPSGKRRPAVAVTAGGSHACALLEDGDVLCWGSNEAGQLGDGTTVARPSPVKFELSGGATALHVGFAGTCARVEGELRCAGRPLPGLLEDGQSRPAAVTELSGAKQIALGRLHGCALHDDGRVACWGNNHFGQLGDGTARGCGKTTVSHRDEPVFVPGVKTAVEIAMGDTGSCALLASGAVQCWGRVGLKRTPGSREGCIVESIDGLARVKRVQVGAHHGCALLVGGEILCWGSNAIGQLGVLREGTTPTGHGGGGAPVALPPLKVAIVDDAEELASFGRAHSCALRSSGRVFCWGRNVEGQIGDGTTTSRHAPVSVQGLDDATAIAVGYDFSCALRRSGRVVCWGGNEHGQLGDGSRRQRSRPVEVRF